MRKLGIIILFILLFSVWGLWYLGGQKADKPANDSQPKSLDEKLVALVKQTNTANGRPFIESSPLTAGANAVRYDLTDLKLTASSDRPTMDNYSRTVKAIFASPGLPSPGLELRLAMRAFENQSAAEADSVRQIAARRRAMAEQLKNLTVPASIKLLHLNLTNAALGLAEVDFYLSEILTEPLVALDSAQLYETRYERLVGAVNILNQFLINQNLPIVAAI